MAASVEDRRSGAYGVTSYTATTPVEARDWRHRAAAPVEDQSRRTSREPAAGIMDLRRSCGGLGADRARTLSARVYTLLDLDNLPGSATRLLRQ